MMKVRGQTDFRENKPWNIKSLPSHPSFNIHATTASSIYKEAILYINVIQCNLFNSLRPGVSYSLEYHISVDILGLVSILKKNLFRYRIPLIKIRWCGAFLSLLVSSLYWDSPLKPSVYPQWLNYPTEICKSLLQHSEHIQHYIYWMINIQQAFKS